MNPDILRHKKELTLDEIARLMAGVEAETPENRENVISALRILLGEIEKLRLIAKGPDSIANVPLRTASGDYNWDSHWRSVFVTREALENWFAREGHPLPKGLTPMVRSSLSPSDQGGQRREALLRIIGGLVVLLIEKSGQKYRKGEKLNKSALHADIVSTLNRIGASTTGVGQSQFYAVFKEILTEEFCTELNKAFYPEE